MYVSEQKRPDWSIMLIVHAWWAFTNRSEDQTVNQKPLSPQDQDIVLHSF